MRKGRWHTPLVTAVILWPLWTNAQRATIPESIAKGGVGGIAPAPSGPTPSVAQLLATTDLIVVGTLGEPQAYLSKDQTDIFTDYPLAKTELLYESGMMPVSTPGSTPSISVTQKGGTIALNGVNYTHTEAALAPLAAGTRGLFLLHRDGTKFTIAGTYYGAFQLVNGRLFRLCARQDFAEDLQDIPVDEAVARLMTIVRASRSGR